MAELDLFTIPEKYEATDVTKPLKCALNPLEDLITEDFIQNTKTKLQCQHESLEVQEEYIKDEQRNLKKEYLHAQEEIKRIQLVPLIIGQFLEVVG